MSEDARFASEWGPVILGVASAFFSMISAIVVAYLNRNAKAAAERAQLAAVGAETAATGAETAATGATTAASTAESAATTASTAANTAETAATTAREHADKAQERAGQQEAMFRHIDRLIDQTGIGRRRPPEGGNTG
jgi:hypothetical protein